MEISDSLMAREDHEQLLKRSIIENLLQVARLKYLCYYLDGNGMQINIHPAEANELAEYYITHATFDAKGLLMSAASHIDTTPD